MRNYAFWISTIIFTAAGLAYAQGSFEPDDSAIRDFKAVEAALHRHDGLTYTGNPDVDFRKHLITKRQSIIDMAEVAMAHARDPKTEELARKVIANQKRDIAEMQQWLQTYQTK